MELDYDILRDNLGIAIGYLIYNVNSGEVLYEAGNHPNDSTIILDSFNHRALGEEQLTIYARHTLNEFLDSNQLTRC